MTRVYCTLTECVHNDGCMCERDVISIGEDYVMGCDDYEDYLDSEDYQTEFFIRVMAADKKIARAKRKGKRIEYNGYVFYTEDKESPEMSVTEEMTGLRIGRFRMLKDAKNWNLFVENIPTFEPVTELPMTMYNHDTRQYEYVKKELKQI